MSNRAQMEIMGLVIIVILLSIGLLFAIVILTKAPTKEISRVKESIQAANFLNTIMSTTSIGCNRRTVRSMLQDCAPSGENWETATICENGLTTCQTASDMIRKMLKDTLWEWGKNYKFFINGTDAVKKIVIQVGDCKGEREGSTRPEKISPGLDIHVSLHICQ